MRRSLAPLAVLVSLALGAPAHAGPFTYTDPADMPANGGADILSVTYATAGKGKGRAYAPTTLVVTMTLGAPPLQHPVVAYYVDARVDGCGRFTFGDTPGTVTSRVLGESLLFLGCGGESDADPTSDGTILFPKLTVAGSTLTWTIGLKALPKQTRTGAELTSLRAVVDVVEPISGGRITEVDSEIPTPGLLDTATTDKTWKIG